MKVDVNLSRASVIEMAPSVYIEHASGLVRSQVMGILRYSLEKSHDVWRDAALLSNYSDLLECLVGIELSLERPGHQSSPASTSC
jgi:hypothetical protein